MHKLQEIGRRKRTEFLEDTKIVESKDDINLLSVWLNIPKIQTDLLYRGSRDGFTSAKFHELCDDQGATLTIVKSEMGFVFGGFSSVSWIPNGQYYPDDKAFLFSLVFQTKLD